MKTAFELAFAVAAGETSAVDVCQTALDGIASRDGEISAFLHICADEALVRASEVDASIGSGVDPGPLAGVPVAIKDALCTRGIPTTAGSKILDRWIPPYSATAVERLEAAGAIVIGKANCDEFAMGSSTENSGFGPTRNPHDTDRVPGGSSGGSAASVAAGFTPIGIGSDTGGSIRQPASLCGVVGMKPTYGRVSRYGLIAFASSLDQIGPMSIDVRDAALTFAVMAGADPLDATCLDEPSPDVLGVLDEGVDGLRFGIVTELCTGDAFEPDVLSAFRDVLTRIEKAGGEIVEVSLPSIEYALSAYYLIAPAEASSNLARFDGVRYGLRVDGRDVESMNRATREAGFGAEVKRRIMLGTYALSAGYYDAYYGQAQKVRTLIIDEFAKAYGQADVLVSPTSPTVAFEIGARTQNPLAMYAADACTIPSNLAGHPAISIPCGTDSDGLPIGFQVLAPALAEQLMFRVAAGVEALL